MPRIVLESYQRGSSKFNFYQLVRYIHKQFNYWIYLTNYFLDDDKKQPMSRKSLRLMDKFKITAAVGEARKIKRELLGLSGLPEQPG